MYAEGVEGFLKRGLAHKLEGVRDGEGIINLCMGCMQRTCPKSRDTARREVCRECVPVGWLPFSLKQKAKPQLARRVQAGRGAGDGCRF